jgi:hypothetical protein
VLFVSVNPIATIDHTGHHTISAHLHRDCNRLTMAVSSAYDSQLTAALILSEGFTSVRLLSSSG